MWDVIFPALDTLIWHYTLDAIKKVSLSRIKYICIYMFIYMPVKVKKRMPLQRSTFYDVENITPLVGLEPTILRLHVEFH